MVLNFKKRFIILTSLSAILMQRSSCLAVLQGEEEIWNDQGYWPSVRQMAETDSAVSELKSKKQLGLKEEPSYQDALLKVDRAYKDPLLSLESSLSERTNARHALLRETRDAVLLRLDLELEEKLKPYRDQLATFEKAAEPFEREITRIRYDKMRSARMWDTWANQVDGLDSLDMSDRITRQQELIKGLAKYYDVASIEATMKDIKDQHAQGVQNVKGIFDEQEATPSAEEKEIILQLDELKAKKKTERKKFEEELDKINAMRDHYETVYETARLKARETLIPEFSRRKGGDSSSNTASSSSSSSSSS